MMIRNCVVISCLENGVVCRKFKNIEITIDSTESNNSRWTV